MKTILGISRSKTVSIIAIILVIIAFLLGLKIRTMVPGNGLYWMNDYQLYYESGQSILQGTPLYDLKIGPFEYPFTYTPFAAILLASLSIFSIPVGQILWFTTNLIALALCCWISLRMMGINKGKKIIITAFIVACSSMILDPILCHQFFGQINIFIMLLVLIDFYHGLPLKLRGIFTGIAAGIKLTPLLFIVYMLVIGKPKQMMKSIIAFIGTLIIGWLIVPTLSYTYWLEGAFLIPELTQTDVMHSIFGFFARVAGTPTQPPVIALVVAIILGLFGVYMGRSVLNKGHQLLSLIIIGDVTLLISPVTWIATMVWIVPTLIWLAFAKWKNKTKLPYAIGFIVLIWHIIPIYWFAQRVGDAIPYQTTLLGNLLATIGSPLFPIFFIFILSPLWVKCLKTPNAIIES